MLAHGTTIPQYEQLLENTYRKFAHIKNILYLCALKISKKAIWHYKVNTIKHIR